MRPVKKRFREDRDLRDAARSNMKADVDFLKRDVERESIGARLLSTGRRGAGHVGFVADTTVRENPGKVTSVLALALAGIVAFFFRDRIAAALGDLLGRGDSGATNRNAWAPEPLRKVIERVEAEIETIKSRIGETR